MRAAIRSTRNTFLVSLVFSLPVVVVSMGFRSKQKGGLSEGEWEIIILGTWYILLRLLFFSCVCCLFGLLFVFAVLALCCFVHLFVLYDVTSMGFL